MTERNALNEVRELLTPDTFYDKFHREIYRAILRIDQRGDRPDMITVMDEVRETEGFTPYGFAQVAGHHTPDIYQHAAILHDKEIRRRFYLIGNYLTGNCFSEENDIVDVLTSTREMLDGLFRSSTDNISSIKDAVDGVYRQIDANLRGDTLVTGTATGFPEFDKRSGGLQRTDLVVIAADTSMGKTSMAISLAVHSRSRIAFYSMEMKKEQIAARMMAIESGVPANEILYSRLSDKQLITVDEGVSRVLQHPVYFDDRSTSNIDTILASIRTMKIKYDIDGAVVDYLQILNVNMRGSSKEQQMGDVARRLKNLAKELDIWIIALSQLNRDNSNPVPTLHRLRDSGQIAEAADVVMLIYRPEVYGKFYPDPFQNASTQATAMIDVVKGRNIGLFRFLCGFRKETTCFYPLEHIPIENDDRF